MGHVVGSYDVRVMTDNEYPNLWTEDRAEQIARALDAWDMYATGLAPLDRDQHGFRGHIPDDAERIAIRKHLSTSSAPSRDWDWMTASCPSLLTARRMYPTKETP